MPHWWLPIPIGGTPAALQEFVDDPSKLEEAIRRLALRSDAQLDEVHWVVGEPLVYAIVITDARTNLVRLFEDFEVQGEMLLDVSEAQAAKADRADRDSWFEAQD